MPPLLQRLVEEDEPPAALPLPTFMFTERAREWYDASHYRSKDQHSIADCCRDAHLNLRRATFLLKVTGLSIGIAKATVPCTITDLNAGLLSLLVIVATLLLEFWSLQDMLPAWVQILGMSGTRVSDKRWKQWLFFRMLSSLAAHAVFLATCATIGKAMQFMDSCRQDLSALCLGVLWMIGTNVQVFHALFCHTPTGEKMLRNYQGRDKEYITYDAWEQAWDRDRTPWKQVGGMDVNILEIRFCIYANHCLVVDWEGTHYESSLDWARALGAFSIMATFPTSFQAEMGQLQTVVEEGQPDRLVRRMMLENQKKYKKRVMVILKLARCYAWMVILPDRCVLLLYQSLCILGTPLEEPTTYFTIFSSLLLLLFADTRGLWQGACMAHEAVSMFRQDNPNTKTKWFRTVRFIAFTGFALPLFFILFVAGRVSVQVVTYWLAPNPYGKYSCVFDVASWCNLVTTIFSYVFTLGGIIFVIVEVGCIAFVISTLGNIIRFCKMRIHRFVKTLCTLTRRTSMLSQPLMEAEHATTAHRGTAPPGQSPNTFVQVKSADGYLVICIPNHINVPVERFAAYRVEDEVELRACIEGGVPCDSYSAGRNEGPRLYRLYPEQVKFNDLVWVGMAKNPAACLHGCDPCSRLDTWQTGARILRRSKESARWEFPSVQCDDGAWVWAGMQSFCFVFWSCCRPYLSVSVQPYPTTTQICLHLHNLKEEGRGSFGPEGPLHVQVVDGQVYEATVKIGQNTATKEFTWSHAKGSATVSPLLRSVLFGDDVLRVEIADRLVFEVPMSPKVDAVQSPFAEGFDEEGAPVWHAAWNKGFNMPEKCSEKVINATLKLASRVATKGLGEKQLAKGFFIIIGDRERLLNGRLGTYGKYNKYAAIEINVLDMDDEARTFVLPDFIMDKAIIICGQTGRILANKFSVADISAGDDSQGTKHQAASAIAKEGFFSIKCSEDSCSADDRALGNFKIFAGSGTAIEVIVKNTQRATASANPGFDCSQRDAISRQYAMSQFL